ncbi:hypothetical protein Bca4012_082929 [Brassica carinata]
MSGQRRGSVFQPFQFFAFSLSGGSALVGDVSSPSVLSSTTSLLVVLLEVKMENECIENKQSRAAASCSSVSEGSGGSSFLKSPLAVVSPH